jgi:hypothetical protein
VTEVVAVEQVRERIVGALGLEPRLWPIDSPEVLAGLIRRAASLVTPCPPRAMRQRVLTGLRGLVEDGSGLDEAIDSVIDSLTGYGDLIELPDPDEHGQRSLLYAAPPSFVETAPGIVFVLGIPPDGQDILPETMAARIIHRGHTRSLRYAPAEQISSALGDLGLQGLPEKLWLRQPRVEKPDAMKLRFDQKLDGTASSPSVDGLIILDTQAPVTYYKGRWSPPKRLSGRYVGRREQRYGAPLWCYVELDGGTPKRLLDITPNEWRGCDLAWQLQMALDALAGAPQRFSADLTEAGTAVVRFFSPLPSWWQRRWDVLGTPVRVPHSLLAYELPYEQFIVDLPRLRDDLWLTELTSVARGIQ